jgi:hypothetical protein
MKSGVLGGAAAAMLLASVLPACDRGQPSDPSEVDAAMHDGAPPQEAGAPPEDASPPVSDADTVDADVPTGGGRAPIGFLLPDTQCARPVGAQCDGREDCAEGQTCCGVYDPLFFSYRSISCSASCDSLNDFELCHPGESCSRAGYVCRMSLVLPYDFIGVCAPPDAMAQPVIGTAVAGEIACGDERCATSAEHCCLRPRYDFGAMSLDGLEPYCAPLAQRCDCDYEPEPPDAGNPDAGPPDAGPVDAGDDEDAG